MKNKYINPKLIETIEVLKKQYLHTDTFETVKETPHVVEPYGVNAEQKEATLIIKDSNGKTISFCGSVVKFQILIESSVELVKGETNTIKVE